MELTLNVIFEPDTISAESVADETLLDCARRADVHIASVCGGRGICKSCIVQIMEGSVAPPSVGDRQFFSAHKLEQGWRRACQVNPVADCRINVPAHTRAKSVRHQLDGHDYWIKPDPLVQTCRLELSPPSMDDSVADVDRLLRALSDEGLHCQHVDYQLMKHLPQILRNNGWRVQAVLRLGEVIALLPDNTPLVGLAVDLGTTNIGLFLIDLHKGTTIASTGMENPQSIHGGDVISRTAAAKLDPATASEMQRLVVKVLNESVAGLCKKYKLELEHIVDIVVAGNTAMHHLLLGLPVDNLGLTPFIPTINAKVDIKARELKLLCAPGGYVHVMQNIAGYVGGDHTAMLLGIRADEETRTVLALDIGTNTEISLIHEGQMRCLSCPSGPALEGGHITSGMRAAEGAIEAIQIKNDEIKLRTIGDALPLGLCGSGVIDATAAFYRAGGINEAGRIIGDYVHTRGDDRNRMLVLHEGDSEVVFSQEDVRAVQLAKGAVRVGIELLLEDAGLTHDDIDCIVIAGAFGAYINIDSARAIGMVPNLPDERYEQIGNAAGVGTKLALVSYPYRNLAESLASSNKYIELAVSREFTSSFMKHINFPSL
jgi:uncharacterized 2Fe-2S/4Fe-4S cluster protein (DUF4445 family)